MTTIGIIGAGEVGSQIARAALSTGYKVVIANSRGPETLKSLIAELGPSAQAARAAEAAAAGDFAVVAVPLKVVNNMPVEERYYSHGGKTVAVRYSSGSLSYLLGDHQGTATATVNMANLSYRRRYSDPFGDPRGPAPTSWPDDKGFVGGTKDVRGDSARLQQLRARHSRANGRRQNQTDRTDPARRQGLGH